MGQPKLSAAPGLTSSPGRREESQDRFSAAPNLGAFKMRREVLHVSLWEVGGRGASQEMPHRGTRRGESRIAVRGEVARIAGHRDLTPSRDQ